MIDINSLTKKQRELKLDENQRKRLWKNIRENSEVEIDYERKLNNLAYLSELYIHKYLIPKKINNSYLDSLRIANCVDYTVIDLGLIVNIQREFPELLNEGDPKKISIGRYTRFKITLNNPIPSFIKSTEYIYNKTPDRIYVDDFLQIAEDVEREMYINAVIDYLFAFEKYINFLSEFRTSRYGRFIQLGTLKTLGEIIDANPDWGRLAIEEIGEQVIADTADEKTRLGQELQMLEQLIELGNK